MFPAGLKMMFFGFAVQAAVFAGISSLRAESEMESPHQLPESQSTEDESLSEFGEPFTEIDRLLSDEADSIFAGSSLIYRSSQNPTRDSTLFRQLSYGVPPRPSEPGDDIPPSPFIPPQPMDEQPSQLSPTPLEFAPRQCDVCEPLFPRVINRDCCHEVDNWSPIAQFFGIGRNQDPNVSGDVGIGHERVVFAPFEIDPTQPTNFSMIRWDSGFGLQTPDRAEYFTIAPGKGPAFPPNSIKYQDLRFINEAGTDSVSVQTEIPVRFIEPYSGGSTSGMGDMKVATKLRLVNGKKWQITQILRTYIPTGSASKGVGTGHVSMEPGVLARYEINPATFVHGQVKYWIPIAGDPGLAGDVLTYGVGISHVLYETNNFAIIPDLEMVNYDFLTGNKTLNGVSISSNGETTYNVVTGARFVIGPKGDLGLFEFGISNMIGIGTDRYVNDLLRFDFKFVY